MTTPFVTRAASRLARMTAALHRKLTAPAPVRPTVLIQSDDWGNAGMADAQAIIALNQLGMPVPVTPWDVYGLEDREDLQTLGDLLLAQRDADGGNAVMSAVFVMANADTQRMLAEGYRELRTVPIGEGFPSPWQQDCLMPAYRQLVEAGAFYPALHGYTHFNPLLLLTLAREESPRGERIRRIHALGIPYVTSQTPEFIFALLDRSTAQESFLDSGAQRQWLDTGMALFERSFGRKPLSTCAPGYRFNTDTCALWQAAGIPVVHNTVPIAESGVWCQPRNVFFEPVLKDHAVDAALREAERAVHRGDPVVICTHSINYVTRHVGRASHGRAELSRLLTALRQRHPDLRFAHELTLYQAWQRNDADWWRAPTASERLARLAA